MTELTRAALPVPTSVSPAAQEWLATTVESRPYPELTDTEGWLDYVRERDAMLRERFGDRTLPVTAEDTEIAGVHTFVLRGPEVSESDTEGPIQLDIHGGALLLGGGDLARVMSSGFALASGLNTWGVDYRMPPTDPYPASLDDCVAVYRALLEVREPADIIVSGASAGGNLAAALLVRAKDDGLPMPAALVLVSPEVDLTESGDSFVTNNGVDNMLRSLRPVNALYAAGHDLTHPYLSPLFADLTGFPPTFLQAGTRDLFLSNTVRMHRALRAAGVAAELHVFEAMPHGGFGGGTPEDVEVFREIRSFVDRHRRDR